MNKISPRIMKQHIALSNHGKTSHVTFFAPSHPNDRKRVGRELNIRVGKASIILNGTQMRSLRSVLERAELAECFS